MNRLKSVLVNLPIVRTIRYAQFCKRVRNQCNVDMFEEFNENAVPLITKKDEKKEIYFNGEIYEYETYRIDFKGDLIIFDGIFVRTISKIPKIYSASSFDSIVDN